MEKQVSKDRDKKKAAAEMLVLALLEERNRHGYEIGKLIEQRSGGVLKFHGRLPLHPALPSRETGPDPGPLAGEGRRAPAPFLRAHRRGTAVVPTLPS